MSSVDAVPLNTDQASVPAVTVLIPAYNGGPLLRQAVESILAQTFTDFECLVIDDGSTDGAVDALCSICDARLRIVRNPKNLGLIATLNRGLELARAPLLARMDADDVAHPSRLQRQVEVLAARPELALVGCWARMIGLHGEPAGDLVCPVEPQEVLRTVLVGSPFVHPAVTARTSILRELGGYPTDALHAEDYALWLKLLLRHDAANIPEQLLDYRVHPGQVSQRKIALQRAATDRTRRAARAEYASTGRLALAAQPPEPGRWARLLGRHGTLGGDYRRWASRYWIMGARAAGARTALAGLRTAPLCLGLYRLLTPPELNPRYWWRRLTGAGE